MKTTPQSRSALRALEAKATPQPWAHGSAGPDQAVLSQSSAWNPNVVARVKDFGKDDAAFIVAARNALPGLLDDLDDAERELALLRKMEQAARRAMNHDDPISLHVFVEALAALDAFRKRKESDNG